MRRSIAWSNAEFWMRLWLLNPIFRRNLGVNAFCCFGDGLILLNALNKFVNSANWTFWSALQCKGFLLTRNLNADERELAVPLIVEIAILLWWYLWKLPSTLNLLFLRSSKKDLKRSAALSSDTLSSKGEIPQYSLRQKLSHLRQALSDFLFVDSCWASMMIQQFAQLVRPMREFCCLIRGICGNRLCSFIKYL